MVSIIFCQIAAKLFSKKQTTISIWQPSAIKRWYHTSYAYGDNSARHARTIAQVDCDRAWIVTWCWALQLMIRATNNGKYSERSSAQLALDHYVWVVVTFFRARELNFRLSCKCREREILSIPFFLQFSLCSSLARSFEPFHYYFLIFLSFQFSALKPDHPSEADLQIRPRKQTTTVQQWVRSAPHQTTTTHLMGPQIRPPNPSTIPDHQTRPVTKSGYQSRLPLPHQPTKLDQPSRLSSLTTQLQIGTAHPTSWGGTGQMHSLWVGSKGGI